MVADGLGLPPSTQGLLAYLFERWDGHGPVALRRGGDPAADADRAPGRRRRLPAPARRRRPRRGLVRERAGHAFDPDVAACLRPTRTILALDSRRRRGSRRSPASRIRRAPRGRALDRGLAAMGNFADLISPYLAGHGGRGRAGRGSGAAEGARRRWRGGAPRAALVHDLGRVAVNARIWQKPAALTADEVEQVRLHAYHSERVLARSAFLSALAPVAGAPTSGSTAPATTAGPPAPSWRFPRACSRPPRFHAMTEPRPHRPAIAPDARRRSWVGKPARGDSTLTR